MPPIIVYGLFVAVLFVLTVVPAVGIVALLGRGAVRRARGH